MQMPNDYQQLAKSGLFQRLVDANDPLFIWDANFAYVARNGFERLEDQVVDIFPFATTAGGHYFGYLVDHLPSSKIYLFYRDSYEAETIAGGIGELIFRQLIQFSGSENLSDSDWTEETAQEYIHQVSNAFEEFLSPEMLSELRRVSSSKSVLLNGWSTLISEDDSEELIEKFANAGGEELEWRC